MKKVKLIIDGSKEYISACSEMELEKGDIVLFSNNKSIQSGQVIGEEKQDGKVEVIRKANNNDLQTIRDNEHDAKNAMEEAKRLVKKFKLEMSLVDSYYTFDRKQLFFLFVAEARVDFRQLAKKLAEKYKTRIELRQIGIRDKAKRIGGIGPCGLFLCCNSFLTDFNSVSINMAKNQFLALNPTKINGLCGRLLCCLKYEDDLYKELRAATPKLYSEYKTEKGKGKIIGVDIFKGTMDVELEDKTVLNVNYREKDGSIE